MRPRRIFRLNFDGRVSRTLKLPDFRQRRGYFDLVNASFAGRRFVNSNPQVPGAVIMFSPNAEFFSAAILQPPYFDWQGDSPTMVQPGLAWRMRLPTASMNWEIFTMHEVDWEPGGQQRITPSMLTQLRNWSSNSITIVRFPTSALPANRC